MWWRIEQNGPHEWAIRNARGEVHFAQTPEEAVRLMVALKAQEDAR